MNGVLVVDADDEEVEIEDESDMWESDEEDVVVDLGQSRGMLCGMDGVLVIENDAEEGDGGGGWLGSK